MTSAHDARLAVVIVNALGRGGVERGASNSALGFQSCGLQTRIGVTDSNSIGRKAPGGVAEDLDDLIEDPTLEPDIVHVHAHRLAWSAVERARRRWPTAIFVEQSIWSRPMPSTRHANVIVHQSPWMMACFQSRTAFRRVHGRSIVLGAPVRPGPHEPDDHLGRSSHADLQPGRDRFRERYKLPPEAVVITRVGQAVSDKWDAVLVDAYRDVAQRDRRAHLLLVAAPTSVREQVELLPEHLRRRVRDIEWVDTDGGMAEVYAASDIFAHAARRGESFGFVVIEAISAGVPVLALSTPEADNAQVDWILESGAGRVASDRASFLKQLAKMVGDAAERERLAPRGIGFDQRFAPEEFTKALLVNLGTGRAKLRRSMLQGPRTHLETLRRIGDESRLTRLLTGVRPALSWNYKLDRLWTEALRWLRAKDL